MSDQKILVVDDEPYILRSMTYVLRREGFHVVEGRNGEEALELVRKERPALVFLDIMMPRKDGYEVVEALRQEGLLDDIHVILLTAKGQESDRRKGLGLGAHEYLTKPFSPLKIVEKARDRMVDRVAGSSIVILASHSFQMLRRICNLGMVLDAGEMVYFGPINNAIDEYKKIYQATPEYLARRKFEAENEALVTQRIVARASPGAGAGDDDAA